MRRPATLPFFPYTTLFRSKRCNNEKRAGREEPGQTYERWFPTEQTYVPRRVSTLESVILDLFGDKTPGGERSEEHTSELQSHVNLVCRLLLEKKNNIQHTE